MARAPVDLAAAVQSYEALLRLDSRDAVAMAELVTACAQVDVARAEQVGMTLFIPLTLPSAVIPSLTWQYAAALPALNVDIVDDRLVDALEAAPARMRQTRDRDVAAPAAVASTVVRAHKAKRHRKGK